MEYGRGVLNPERNFYSIFSVLLFCVHCWRDDTASSKLSCVRFFDYLWIIMVRRGSSFFLYHHCLRYFSRDQSFSLLAFKRRNKHNQLPFDVFHSTGDYYDDCSRLYKLQKSKNTQISTKNKEKK